MKRFLALNFNFIDDLRRAAASAEKAGDGAAAGHLTFYADQLELYRPERRYLCSSSGRSTSALRVWQKNTLKIAAQYDRYIFTWSEIEDLAKRLDEYAHQQKNCDSKIIAPRDTDQDLAERYGMNVLIGIGEGCSISFTPIKGDYGF